MIALSPREAPLSVDEGGIAAQGRFLIILAMLMSLAAMAAIAWKLQDGHGKQLLIAQADLQLHGEVLGAVVEAALEAAEQTLLGVSNRIEMLHQPTPDRLALRRLLLRAPALKDLLYYDEAGRLVDRGALSPVDHPELPAEVQERVAQGLETGLVQVDGHLVVYRRVLDAQQQPAGTVVAILDPSDPVQALEQSPGLDATAVFLIDSDDRVLTRIIALQGDDDTDQALAVVRGSAAHDGLKGTRFYQAPESLVLVHRLRGHPIRLVIVAPRALALVPWQAERNQGVALALVFALVALLSAAYGTQAMRRQSRLMTELHRKNLLIEQAPVAIVITDLDANVVYSNPAFTERTGYPSEEISGLNPRLLQSGKTEASTYAALWQSLTQGEPWRGTLANRRKDGSEFWEESFIAPMRDLQGRVTHYFAVKIDVTQRKLAEDRLLQAQTGLQASKDLLDRLSENVPGAICQFQFLPDGRWLIPYASNSLHDVFEVTPEQAREEPRRVLQRVHPEDRPTLVQSIQDAAREQQPWRQEFRVILPGKGLRWLSSQANPPGPTAVDALWHGFTTDVTDRRRLQQAVVDHARELRTVLDNSSVGISFVKDRRQVWANRRMSEMFGYSPDEMQGRHTRHFYVSEADFKAVGELAYPALARGERFETELLMRRADGQVIWIRLFGKAVNAPDLNDGSIWVFENITGQRQIQEKLKLAASVFTHAREAIMITDTEANIVDVNEAFTRLTGYEREEVLGSNPKILSSGRQPPSFYEDMWRDLLLVGHWSGEIWNRKKSGELFAELVTISGVRDGEGQVQRYVALFSDITPIKEQQRQLEQMAHFDALTGLPNRVLLADRLRQDLAQCRRRGSSLAVVFLDLDGFKAINDEHGHGVGDQVLIVLAQRLKRELRAGDTLARLGGDEFVAVLTDLTRSSDLEWVLSRLLSGACESMLIEGMALQVSASMGIARFPQDGSDEDHLLRNADQAMYAAKQAGKNRYQYFDAGPSRGSDHG